jgi:hypothetical protein
MFLIHYSKNISSSTWENYFSRLFSVKPEFERQNNYYNNILNKLDFSNTVLDSEISEKEMLAAVKELKNNKAAGVDCIKNEMIKHSISFILPCLKMLFNNYDSNKWYLSIRLENWLYKDTF